VSTNTGRLINQQILCYLSPEARQAVSKLEEVGLDTDLAIGVVESLYPDNVIFQLEDGILEEDT
jgi:hypothetical protein